MKIVLPDGSTVVLTDAQLRSLRGAGRGDLHYSPPTMYRAPSERTQGMYTLRILGKESAVTVAARTLYDMEPPLLEPIDGDLRDRLTLTPRGWDVLNAVNAGKFTLSHERPGALARRFGVFASLADARAVAAVIAARHPEAAAYTPVAVPVGVEPLPLHPATMAEAGVRV